MSSNFVTSMFSNSEVEYEPDDELERKRQEFASVASATDIVYGDASHSNEGLSGKGSVLLDALESLVNGSATLSLPASFWRSFDSSGRLQISEQGLLPAGPSSNPSTLGVVESLEDGGYFICPPSAEGPGVLADVVCCLSQTLVLPKTPSHRV
jgi:hypothetical protein